MIHSFLLSTTCNNYQGNVHGSELKINHAYHESTLLQIVTDNWQSLNVAKILSSSLTFLTNMKICQSQYHRPFVHSQCMCTVPDPKQSDNHYVLFHKKKQKDPRKNLALFTQLFCLFSIALFQNYKPL